MWRECLYYYESPVIFVNDEHICKGAEIMVSLKDKKNQYICVHTFSKPNKKYCVENVYILL